MKKAVIFLLISVFFLSVFFPLHCFASYNSELGDVEAEIVYVISLDNDEVIFDKNVDKKTAPASLTKIMTALLTLENVQDLTKVFTVSASALAPLAGTGSSNANLVEGEQMTVKDLLHCLLIPSAGDAACVLAEGVGGNISAFVEMMNKKAQQLGMTSTHYANPFGYDNDEHYTTARDMAKLVREALKYPIFEKITSLKEYTVGATNKSEARYLQSTIYMMNPNYERYYLPYVTGIKTGTTDNAGRCIITKASKDGYTYLAIVMRGKNINENGEEINGAFVDCKKILKWIYNNIKYKVIADENQTISVCDLKYCWKSDHVRLVPAEEVYALVPYSLDASSLYYELSDNLKKPLKATVKKGEVVGTATAYYGGNPITTIDLTVEKTMRHSIIVHILTVFKAAWNNLFGKVLIIALVLTIIALFVLKKLIKMKVIDVSQIKYDRNLKKHLK